MITLMGLASYKSKILQFEFKRLCRFKCTQQMQHKGIQKGHTQTTTTRHTSTTPRSHVPLERALVPHLKVP
jgi:hypothetical protein